MHRLTRWVLFFQSGVELCRASVASGCESLESSAETPHAVPPDIQFPVDFLFSRYENFG